MDRSGPGCRKTDSDFTGELGCRAGHEGSHLFMPDLHEVDGAFCSIQCRHEAADAVSGIPEHPPHAPGVEAHPEEIRNGLGHGHLPWLGNNVQADPMLLCAPWETDFRRSRMGSLAIQWCARLAFIRS